MAKSRKKLSGDGWVFAGASDAAPDDSAGSLSRAPAEHRLRLRVEKRARGKVVTTIGPLALGAADAKALGKQLKSACGVGGTLADDQLELQGDCLDRARDWLSRHGWGLA